jgi:hypothetical protein
MLHTGLELDSEMKMRYKYKSNVLSIFKDMKLALIETNHRRVAVSSAKIRKNMPPIKLPTENMVTKGYGSLDQDRLRIFFSIPVYYFRECKTWTVS